MKKSILTNFSCACILLMLSSCTRTQTTRVEFDPEKYNPTYTLAFPDGWNVERFAIPIEFAPSIPYSGVEDIRFTPGWSDATANDYWAYAFLWYLDGKPEITPQVIEKNLTAYYTGLVGRNIDKRKIPQEKLVPVKASITKATTDEGDLQTFSGTISMLDYMEQKPMTLNCIIHVKSCSDENHTYVFYEISPQPLENEVWKSLDELSKTFGCDRVKGK